MLSGVVAGRGGGQRSRVDGWLKGLRKGGEGGCRHPHPQSSRHDDKPWGFLDQSVYMKSLILRSSRAFLGGGGFLGLWAIPGDIGAPGVTPAAGKPGLAIGIMGAPAGAPA